LECLIEVGKSNYFDERPQGPNVISDDMGAGVNGLRAMYRKDKKHFDSKSAYRLDVKAHGLAEVGNEQNFEARPATSPKDFYGEKVKAAYEQFDGNYRGTADRVKRDEQITQWRRNNG
jgi:hypothetical protein